jgi:diguanylate cyclase (GGDEF)-like protein
MGPAFTTSPTHAEGSPGPVWWPLGELRLVGGNARLLQVVGLWVTAIVASVAMGVLNVTQQWNGLPFSIAGIEFAVTLYPPLILSVLIALWVGPAWGAIPIYAANVASGLTSGLGLSMSLVFATGGVIETLMFWGSLVVLRVNPEIRRLGDAAWFIATAVVAAVTGSLAAILWNSTHHLPPVEAQRVWRGWVVGDFLQLAFLALPILHFFGPSAKRWLDRRFVSPPEREFTYTHGVVLIVIAFGLLGLVVFLGVHQALGSIELSIDTRTVDGELLIPRLREIVLTMALLSTALIVATGMFSTALARMGERQRHEARRDTLTGCLNRRVFDEHLANELERSRRLGMGLGVLFFDIDHFKRVNDTLGHAAGDRVLVETVRRVERALRTTDFLFRWGGEEFVVLMPHTPASEVEPVAERVRAAVESSPFESLGSVAPSPVTISVGAAAGDANTHDASTLLHAADRRCMEAKRLGRNRVVAS